MEIFIILMNVIVAFLMTGVIYYAMRLNRAIAYLQKSKAEFQDQLEKFVGATARAHQALENIKNHSINSERNMQNILTQMEQVRLETFNKLNNYQGNMQQAVGNLPPALQNAPPPSRGIPKPRAGSQLERVITDHQLKQGAPVVQSPNKNTLLEQLRKFR